ncbi:MAG: hypothetical protein H7647_02475 [Candidatus Heimdallarchaeota archaeon]|nr:hypothetical protein [Candidatus Heimdallarchaeota archaeon]MCK4253293.1 hypothetical protein [Candidatus Heimdallarchaeota archaeon]
MTAWLKKIAKFYGANLIGIAKLDPKWIYSEDRMKREYVIPENLKYAIVIAIEMDQGAINTSPKMPSGIATGLGYSKIAFVRTLVSKFAKNLSFFIAEKTTIIYLIYLENCFLPLGNPLPVR